MLNLKTFYKKESIIRLIENIDNNDLFFIFETIRLSYKTLKIWTLQTILNKFLKTKFDDRDNYIPMDNLNNPYDK